MNIAHLLRDAARARPDHPSLVYEGRIYPYAELDWLTGRFAAHLTQRGLRPGDVVALLLESRPELLIAALGAARAGVVPNIVNAMLKPDEVRAVVADSGAALVIAEADRTVGLENWPQLLTGQHWQQAMDNSPDAGAPALDLDPQTLACLLYTSGTTGRPKGVMLSHRNILDNAIQFARVHFGPDDRLLVAAPLFHCWGLINGVLAVFAAQGTAIVARRFKAEPILELIEAERPTQFMGVPAMVAHLERARQGRAVPSLRTIHCAAAPMPTELIGVLQRDWGVGYAESYGLTETSPVITTTRADDVRPGSCGKAMGDTVLKVADAEGRALPVGEVGELWARGTAITAGYYQRPDATAEVFVEGGWFRTGDIVRMDEEGRVYIVDRAKDMINVGGEKVYPRDVEEVLFRHPAVADAVVTGMPDAVLGEVPKAYIALKPGEQWTAEGVTAYLRPLLASFKVPRAVEFVEAVPRSASGKALRRLLKQGQEA